MALTKLDFTDHTEAQDMIKLIEKDKGLAVSEVIDFSVNIENFNQILDNGWGSIALSLWGHDDPERDWLTMDNPYIEVDLTGEKLQLIDKIAKKDKVDTETAVAYFLLFTMDSLGYHI